MSKKDSFSLFEEMVSFYSENERVTCGTFDEFEAYVDAIVSNEMISIAIQFDAHMSEISAEELRAKTIVYPISDKQMGLYYFEVSSENFWHCMNTEAINSTPDKTAAEQRDELFGFFSEWWNKYPKSPRVIKDRFEELFTLRKTGDRASVKGLTTRYFPLYVGRTLDINTRIIDNHIYGRLDKQVEGESIVGSSTYALKLFEREEDGFDFRYTYAILGDEWQKSKYSGFLLDTCESKLRGHLRPIVGKGSVL